jgi:NADPH:quinone reductase-like Zn-dependent oxidoreductase
VIALVTGPHRVAGLDLTEVDEPDPDGNEAVVAVRASSVNRGKLRLMAMRPNGWTPAFVALVSAGQLDARVAQTLPWADVAVARDALRGRRISGKAVLSVTE